MRILFDARSVRTPAGRQILRGLTTGWAADRRVESIHVAARADLEWHDLQDDIEIIRLGTAGWARHLLRDLPRVADRVAAEIIFSPNATPPRDARAVLYFQDLKHFRLPTHLVPGWRWRLSELGRSSWRRIAAARGLLAVATSRDIAGEAQRRTPLPVVTIPNGVDVGNARWVGDQDFVFVMGGIGPWKGEALAVRAWARLPASVRRGTILVIGGVEPPPRRDALLHLAASLGLASSVSVIGLLSHDAFLERVAAARAAVSCSRFEAFGLPVAEALVMGAPVLCSDVPAHLELLERSGAGRSFAAESEHELSNGLEQILEGVSPRRLCRFPAGWNWHARAAEHLDAYAAHLR